MDKTLFKTIDKIIRNEKLYKRDDLSRSYIMERFGIGRHNLNNQLNVFADGKSFPQYINSIRLEVAFELLTYHPEMSIADIAQAMQPFFTTQPEKERSGMGFSVMQTFMDQVKVESCLGEGTTVRMKKRLRES